MNARARLLASTLLVGAAILAVPAQAQILPQEGAVENPSASQTPQTAADDDQVVEGGEVVVTGSLIQNPNLVASNPVTVVSEQEIELRQSNTAEALLRELPGVVPSIGSAVNNGNGGASFANLRGLGSNRNLVLLDGVRIVPAELQGRVDLNNIPLALVQRADVLTGGASTTYGADAVTGVINFITRSDFSGIDLNVSNQITERGDGNIFRVDATIGANLEDGRGNVVFSIGYQEVDEVFQGDRDVSRFQVDSFSGAVGGSGTSVPTRFSNVNPTGADSIAGVNAVQGTRQINADGTAFRPGAAFDPFNFNPLNVFQTPFERFNMYGAANYELSDAVEVYTRGLFSKNTVSTLIAPSGAFGTPVTVSLNNPFLTTAQRNAFCAFDTNSGVGITRSLSQAQCDLAATATSRTDPNYREVATAVFRRATELGPRVSDFQTTIFDYRLGLRGPIVGNINYDVFGAYGESENVQTQSGYTLNSRVQQSLLVNGNTPGTVSCQNPANGCVPTNFFGPEGSLTSNQLAFLQGSSQISVEVSLAQARGTISGDFGLVSPLATEAIGFAVGGEYRKYRASQFSDTLSQSGDLGGSGGAAPLINGGYEVYEAIGELIVPLIVDRPFFKSLQIEGGIRYSDYTVLAANERSFSTTTYKGAGSWEPFDGVKIRGNYARAVRAPNIAELFNPVNTTLTNLADDPCANLRDNGSQIPGRAVPTGVLRDVCIAQGAPAGVIGSIAVPTAGQAQSTGGGNLDLTAEKSNSYTVGGVFTPSFLPGFSASVDYYNIKIKDAITQPAPADAIAACFGALSVTNPACLGIRRNPIDGSLSGDATTTLGLPLTLSNLGTLKTDGIDVVLNYTQDIGEAKLGLSFNGNWTNSSKFQATPNSVNRDCVGLYSTNCSLTGSIQPEFSWNQRTTIGFGDVDISLLWRHLDRVDYEFANDPEDAAFSGTLGGGLGALTGRTVDFNRIKARDYFDLSARIGVSENFTLIALVQNLLDKDAPLVGNTVGNTTFNGGNTYPSTYDPLGRRFTVTGRVRF
ncbi:TonB-dependent receptor domain-containing protein [uncultured Sphingomonas sp.]|uniref:TonB-dependent receptor domain-containing protein n=1 Tax=uncultured Sphingomonas sp. TaxID=158754 RepID=UPI0035CB99AA